MFWHIHLSFSHGAHDAVDVNVEVLGKKEGTGLDRVVNPVAGNTNIELCWALGCCWC